MRAGAQDRADAPGVKHFAAGQHNEGLFVPALEAAVVGGEFAGLPCDIVVVFFGRSVRGLCSLSLLFFITALYEFASEEDDRHKDASDADGEAWIRGQIPEMRIPRDLRLRRVNRLLNCSHSMKSNFRDPQHSL